MTYKKAERMAYFGEGIFAELRRKRIALQAAGRDIIDLSIGSPDIEPSRCIIDALIKASGSSHAYRYSLGIIPELYTALEKWYRRRYDTAIDAKREMTLIPGAEDALTHFFMVYANPGDKILVPDPLFPAVMSGVRMAEAEPVFMPLRKENNYLIDFDSIDEKDAHEAKIIVASYPNNPTGALATDEFFLNLIAFAKKYDLIVLYDNPYSDMVYDGEPAKSFLRYPGARDVGVEIMSLSKSYSIPGARLAFLVGNEKIVKDYELFKSNIDLGVFLPVQRLAVAALESDPADVELLCRFYKKRRDVLMDGLKKAGMEAATCRGSLFVWMKITDTPSGAFKKDENGVIDDRQFALDLLEQTGVMVAPGSSFGMEGRGYVRLSLMVDPGRMKDAAERIGEFYYRSRLL